MNPWPFVIAAYGITIIGTVLVSIWAWRAAMTAEKRADALRERD
jgi:hypothetical protein